MKKTTVKKIVKPMVEVLYNDQTDKTQIIAAAVSNMESFIKNTGIDKPEFISIIEEIIEELGIKILTRTKRQHNSWNKEISDETKVQWYAYKEYLLNDKEIVENDVNNIDRYSEEILANIGDPKETHYLIKGLVIGEVQSGKTTNYSALINKAFDGGYKFTVILSGMTNDLRSQTQSRINSDVLGYDDTALDMNNGIIGIGKYLGSDSFITSLTSTQKDFTSGKHIMNKEKYLLVIKKNKSILEKVVGYLKSIMNGKNYPILVIDDEADQASVNTEDYPDEETDPSTINRLIRELIHLSKRTSYVGYTATPFANVFINDNFDEESFTDLFPRDFILTLDTPKHYTGYKSFFQTFEEPPFLKEIPYSEQVKFTEQIKNEMLTELPGSLKHAINCFMLTSAIKKTRNCKEKHNTMLIHVSHLNNIQNVIRILVEKYFSNMEYDSSLFKELWEKEYREFSIEQGFQDDWSLIESEIKNIMNSTVVKEINSDANDILNYKEKQVVIAIGGNNVSRGLSLEGLHTSYYLRFSKTYDTLMQMSRWFGYREEYLDLCRVYSTREIFEAFINTFEIFEELKELFNNLYEINGTPKDYELRIRSIETMLPTNRNKMRRSSLFRFNLSDSRRELSGFSISKSQLNVEITKNLFLELSKKYRLHKSIHTNNSIVFEKVNVKDILAYLFKYETNDDGNKKIEEWLKFVDESNKFGELLNFNIAFFNGNNDSKVLNLGKYQICSSNRLISTFNDDEVTIRSQVVVRDLFVDYYSEEELIKSAEEKGLGLLQYLNRNANEMAKYKSRPSEKGGLLIIYYNNLVEQLYDKKVDLGKQTIGIGIRFPKLINEAVIKAETYYTKQ